MIKIFIWGEGGVAEVVVGERGSSERCLKWGCGRWGHFQRDLSKNISKRGWVKAKVVCKGRGF